MYVFTDHFLEFTRFICSFICQYSDLDSQHISAHYHGITNCLEKFCPTEGRSFTTHDDNNHSYRYELINELTHENMNPLTHELTHERLLREED